MNLQGKTIVLTVGTSGIGQALVQQLSDDNTLIVIARQSAGLTALNESHANIHTYGADLSDPATYPRLSAQILAAHPRIDVLINNAAVQNTATVLEPSFSYERIETEIHVNFTAVCALCVLLLPGLQRNNTASIILNVNSGLALAPKTSSAVYCATKAAMNAFSKSLSYQLEHTQVRVTQAFLPLVDTPMTAGRGSDKISATDAAQAIVQGIARDKKAVFIGKTKLLFLLLRLVPGFAQQIMKRA